MKLSITFLFLFSLALICACDHNQNIKTKLHGKTMGTTYNISIIHTDAQPFNQQQLQSDIDILLTELNQKVSTYIANSEISQFNKQKNNDWHRIDEDFFSIVQAAYKVSEETNGAYDSTISPLIDLWGFGNKNTDKTPDKEEIKTAFSDIGYQQLLLNSETNSLKKLNKNLRLDLSGIAKGYAVDFLSDYLIQQKLEHHLVDIGGEIKAIGLNQQNKKWHIAIKQPDGEQKITPNGIEITNQAIATSGDYQNYFIDKGIRRSHIINPKTGFPITHNLASVSVLHKSTMLADAYATAILVLGEIAGKKFALENQLTVYMIIRENNKYMTWTNFEYLD